MFYKNLILSIPKTGYKTHFYFYSKLIKYFNKSLTSLIMKLNKTFITFVNLVER